ncbi:MAG: imidazolonepropionase [Acidobacteria bacterium]|nr:imidazolonepropionase [Acidobacteriota bacterium]
MTDELLILNASQLVTLKGAARPRVGAEMRDLAILENSAVLIRDGLIVATGATSEVAAQAASQCQTLDAANRVVMPGFVDAHTHAVFAGTREDEYEMRAAGFTYQEIAARGGGIRSTVRKTRAASAAELFDMALPRVRWLLEHGTTTIEAKSGYGLTLDDELKILRVIQSLNRDTPLELVPTFLGAHEIPDEYRRSDDAGQARTAYIDLVISEMLPRVANEHLAEFCDVFCEAHVFNVQESRRILKAAKELGFGLRFHADQLSLGGGSQLAAELQATTADHIEWIDEAGIAALQRAKVIAVLLPGAVFNLGLTKYAPARRLIEAGVGVALATDFNPGSSPTPSMQMALSIACTQMQMTPAEALTAATINAAYSLNRGARLGSLESGKQADVVIFDCADYRQIPYFFGINHALTVIKKGRVVVTQKSLGEKPIENCYTR